MKIEIVFCRNLLLMFRSVDGQHFNDAKRGLTAQNIYIEIGGNGVLFSASYDSNSQKKWI